MKLVDYVKVQWDRVGAGVAALAGAGALFVGWLGVSGSRVQVEMLSYIVSGGLAGLFLLGIAGTLWLSADMRDEWRKLDRLQESMDALAARPHGSTTGVEARTGA